MMKTEEKVRERLERSDEPRANLGETCVSGFPYGAELLKVDIDVLDHFWPKRSVI